MGSVQFFGISKLGLNRKIKKFDYSFICAKGYFPPFGGEWLFVCRLRSSDRLFRFAIISKE